MHEARDELHVLHVPVLVELVLVYVVAVGGGEGRLVQGGLRVEAVAHGREVAVRVQRAVFLIHRPA